MMNNHRNNQELAKTLNRFNRASYVRSHIRQNLEETINTVRTKHGMFPIESLDIVLLLIFTYIDLLGYLYKGNSSSTNAVEFIRKYLGRIDTRYNQVGGLLYYAFRHGLVHLATPKRIQFKDGRIIDFLFALVGQREDNYKTNKVQELQSSGSRLEIYRITLNLTLLYEDLLNAIDLFSEDVKNNQELSDVFWEAFETRREPQKSRENELLRKPYIQESDFDFFKEQIANLNDPKQHEA